MSDERDAPEPAEPTESPSAPEPDPGGSEDTVLRSAADDGWGHTPIKGREDIGRILAEDEELRTH